MRANIHKKARKYSWVYVRQYCAKIDEAARNRMELIVRSLAEQNGVTETTESRTPNGMGAADERLQGTGRGNCENRIDLRLSEEVRAENCSDFSHIFQSCGRIVHRFYGIV